MVDEGQAEIKSGPPSISPRVPEKPQEAGLPEGVFTAISDQLEAGGPARPVIEQVAKADTQETLTTQLIATSETQEINKEKVGFRRIQLPDGQLSFRADLPESFSDQVVQLQPWVNSGKDLGSRRRRIEYFKLPDGTEFVLKQSHYSGQRLKQEHSKDTTLRNSPVAQNAMVEKAKRLYLKEYGEELPVETLLGFYIDKETTEMYSLYSYHKPIDYDPWGDEAQEIMRIAREKKEEIARRLQELKVYPGESAGLGGTNYLIVKDNSQEGIGIVLIDTEYWKLEK